MSSIGQYKSLTAKAAVLGGGAACLLSAYILYLAYGLPSASSEEEAGQSQPDPEWISPSDLKDADWSIVAASASGSVAADAGPISSRYRLAGTFIAYGGIRDRRRAVLDDIKASAQKIVSENEEIDDLLILRIFTERVVIRGPQGEEELWLSFNNPRSSPDEDIKPIEEKNQFKEKKNKFGAQVGKRSYIINREVLVDYYNELMDEPQRLVKVFDSLEPIWTADRKIEGYRLNVQGEAEFFKEIGWKQGDVVRAVNSMKMSNRHRAEYFIREFVADRANAFLIDMERDGKPQKMVYRVR